MHAIGRCSVMQSSRQPPNFEAVLFGVGRQTLSEEGALDLIVACLVASRKQKAEMRSLASKCARRLIQRRRHPQAAEYESSISCAYVFLGACGFA